MTELLDEITEIPFTVFKDKWLDVKPGIYNWDRAEKEWFYMHENDRITAFTALARVHPMIQIIREPYQFLQHFTLPF